MTRSGGTDTHDRARLATRLHFVAFLIVAVLVIGGCSGSGSEGTGSGSGADRTFTTADLKRFAARSSDLPEGFAAGQPTAHPEECLTYDPGTGLEAAFLTDLQAIGLQGCSKADVTMEVECQGGLDGAELAACRADLARGVKNTVGGSMSFVFRDADGASKALLVLKEHLPAPGDKSSLQSVPVSGLGDEASGFTQVSSLSGPPADNLTYLWRDGNVATTFGAGLTGALGPNQSVDGELDQDAVLSVAQKIHRRATG